MDPQGPLSGALGWHSPKETSSLSARKSPQTSVRIQSQSVDDDLDQPEEVAIPVSDSLQLADVQDLKTVPDNGLTGHIGGHSSALSQSLMHLAINAPPSFAGGSNAQQQALLP